MFGSYKEEVVNKKYFICYKGSFDSIVISSLRV